MVMFNVHVVVTWTDRHYDFFVRSIDMRRTDKWDKFYLIRLSVTMVARW